MKHRRQTASIIPFPGVATDDIDSDFITETSTVLLKTRDASGYPLPAAFSILPMNTARIMDRNAMVEFQIELRQTEENQMLLFGLTNANQSCGIVIALDPQTGIVADAMNGMGALGDIEVPHHAMGQTFRCSLRIQKFGRNYLSTVYVNGESILYPSFTTDERQIFNGLVGTNSATGGKITYRNCCLAVDRIAKVA